MILDPQQTYVHLADDGRAQTIAGDRFWQLPPSELGAFDQGWLVSEFTFLQDWPGWEMHPHGDEIVYLLSGALDLLLERADGVETIVLEGSGAVLVPRGVWHTAKVRQPSRMLHLTRGKGTEHRPA
jgi:mannose-6-phosphate isomerase-like protein (cupin superfamily)